MIGGVVDAGRAVRAALQARRAAAHRSVRSPSPVTSSMIRGSSTRSTVLPPSCPSVSLPSASTARRWPAGSLPCVDRQHYASGAEPAHTRSKLSR
jgi:hypothetical protein